MYGEAGRPLRPASQTAPAEAAGSVVQSRIIVKLPSTALAVPTVITEVPEMTPPVSVPEFVAEKSEVPKLPCSLKVMAFPLRVRSRTCRAKRGLEEVP
jgi:hypothetical protein